MTIVGVATVRTQLEIYVQTRNVNGALRTHLLLMNELNSGIDLMKYHPVKYKEDLVKNIYSTVMSAVIHSKGKSITLSVTDNGVHFVRTKPRQNSMII